MKKLLLILLMVALCYLLLSTILCSCSRKVEVRGVVTDVEYEEEYEETVLVPMVMPTMIMMFPEPITHEARYVATVACPDTVVVYEFADSVAIGDTVTVKIRR